jgi:hypothetical protein
VRNDEGVIHREFRLHTIAASARAHETSVIGSHIGARLLGSRNDHSRSRLAISSEFAPDFLKIATVSETSLAGNGSFHLPP